MRLVPQIANVVLDAIALCRNALLLCRCGESADTLLLARRERIAKLKVRTIDWSVRRARLIEVIILQHRLERTYLRSGCIVSTAISDLANALAAKAFVRAHKRRHLVLTFLPHPDVLGIVTAATPLVDLKLVAGAQTSAVLPAAALGFKPCRFVKAAAHALIRATADAKRCVKRPPKLCARLL